MNKTDVSETVMLAGKNIECRQDFMGSGDGVCYALRFKGTEYQSAWKYEYMKDEDSNCQILSITTRILPDGFTIADIAKKDFWIRNNIGDLVRIFPASGYNNSGTGPNPTGGQGLSGWFWSSTRNSPTDTYGVHFDKSFAGKYKGSSTRGHTVRLFKDRL